MTDEKEEPINISVNCSSCGTQWMTSPGQRFRCLKCDEEICVPPEELYKIGYRLLEARLARAEELLREAQTFICQEDWREWDDSRSWGERCEQFLKDRADGNV